MKIAFFHELSYGGARRVVDKYGKILQARHQTDLYYLDSLEDQKVTNCFDNVFYFKFLSKKWSGDDWKAKLYKDTVELYKLFSLHKKIASLIDRKNYDFVFINPSRFTQAPFILRFLKTKKVYFCQEPLRIVYDKSLKISNNLPFIKKVYEFTNRKIRKWIDAANIMSAEWILANSKFSSKWIKKSYGIDSFVCYLGVDTDRFKFIKIKKEYDILFLGRKDRIEGYDLFIKAIEIFKKKPIVKVIERDENGRGISDEDLVIEYNKAKTVVALSRNEPFGLIPLEAMACCVPVVAICEGGFKESIIDKKTGFLIKRDPRDLYWALIKLLRNDELRKEIGINAREYVVQNWTWEKGVRRFLEIIEKT